MRKNTLIIVVATYIVCQWLMDLYGNLGVYGGFTNGLWDDFFGLDIMIGHHVAWYVSIGLFMWLAVNVSIDGVKDERNK